MFTKSFLNPLIAVALLVTGTAQAGGGATGVHYLCGSRTLDLSFQLDNRPEARHFPEGTKVLVHERIFKTSFFTVTGFHEEGETATLELQGPDASQPRGLSVTWLGNSIVDEIRLTYTWGMHLDTSEDGKCTPLN